MVREVEGYKSAEHTKMYGLTRDVERGVRMALDEGNGRRLYRLIRPLHSADFADLVERYSGQERRLLVTVVGKYFDPDILAELDHAVREEVLTYLSEEVLIRAVSALPSDDVVEVIGELDADRQQRLLQVIPEADRVLVEEALAYDDDSAGRLMQRETVTVPLNWTVAQTLDFLFNDTDLPDEFYDIFVLDQAGRPSGQLSLSRLLRTERPVLVSDIMSTRFHRVLVHMDQEDVAMLFRQYGLVSAPVVDENNRLVGMITVDDVVDVIDEEAEEDLMHLGGVGEDDLHGGLLDTTRSRFSWLVVNLVTAMIAAGVIGIFETAIEKIVALAVLMPIVSSMGGNAGTQTLTVAVRALAMRELTATNASKFIVKETMVGSFNGIAFAFIAGTVSWIWFGDLQIAAILASAMVINLVVAGVFGTMIPIGLAHYRLDPAVASTVFLTTVTDVIGFLTFLGLATYFLM
ncbi:MAG: magnesium transporter [Rhodospirillaceae bacterium]|nr:magnesium transporter [Rhodospirillaceae bacterium]